MSYNLFLLRELNADIQACGIETYRDVVEEAQENRSLMLENHDREQIFQECTSWNPKPAVLAKSCHCKSG